MPAAQFPASEFDEWADTYDQDVLSHSSFPFGGYEKALDAAVKLAMVQPGMQVLDVGTGTGNLAQRFASCGCLLWCADFSTAMLARAKDKLPQAVCVQADLSRVEWPVELLGPFNRIVSGYTFHHFQLDEKVALLNRLARSLIPDGCIVIADIAFKDFAERDLIRKEIGAAWEEEHYWIAEEALPLLSKAGYSASFHTISQFAGVFVIHPFRKRGKKDA